MKSEKNKKNTKELPEFVFEGIPVSPGIAIGKAFLLEGETVKIKKHAIQKSEVESELSHFHEVLEETKKELATDETTTQKRIGNKNTGIFDMHRMVLEDPTILADAEELVRKKLRSAEFAFYNVIENFQNQLSATNQEYFRERAIDLRDIKRRVIRKLQGDRTDFLQKLEGSAIIIARDLAPSDTIALDRHKILGFATDLGGKTSHSAILSRSFRVPAAVGFRSLTRFIKNGDRIVLDGNEGKVVINPTLKTLDRYNELRKRLHEINEKLSKLKTLPARTSDGKDIELAANIEFTDEIQNVKDYGGKGVGLYRTDYLYLGRQDLPDEDEQFKEYKEIAEALKPYPVIIRTLDVGGDKDPQNMHIPAEDNPYLGYRAIRICLQQPHVFLPQLKAILRASIFGNVKILFPMISSIEELREAKQMLERAKEELEKDKIEFDNNIEIGVMIEVPSAAIMADWFASEADFLSIGTNDLVQYMLAVDRGNERVAYLYKDLHPSVLRMVKTIVQEAHKKGAWVGMCGEMAGNPLATLILIGLGIDELSVSPIVLPEIKKIIRATDFREAARIANKAIEMPTAGEVENYILRYMRRKFKDLIF